MVDSCRTDLEYSPTEPSLNNASPSSTSNEEQFLSHWRKDVERAAVWASEESHLDLHEADDFAQEAYIRLLGAFRKGDFLPDSYVRTLIGSAVRSARRPRLRWASRYLSFESPEVSEADGDVPPSGLDMFPCSDETDLCDIVAARRFIDGAPDRLREVFELMYVQGLTQQEAASRLGITRQRITQLRAELLRRGQEYFGCSHSSLN
jgi:RNA polymerase sigma factor (sigma-70 family)